MKSLTREQLESRKAKAVRFVRDVLGDAKRAEEIADESLEHYAQRRKIQITNPGNRRFSNMATKAQLEGRIQELEEENETLQDQLDAVADIVGAGDDENDPDGYEED